MSRRRRDKASAWKRYRAPVTTILLIGGALVSISAIKSYLDMLMRRPSQATVEAYVPPTPESPMSPTQSVAGKARLPRRN